MMESFAKKLLVEGSDDQHVIWALCQKYEVPRNFEVVDCKGINVLLTQISVRLKVSEVTAIGIVIDADTNILNRWNSIKEILNELHFDCPNYLPEQGLILEKDGIKLGVWIMPNNKLNGMLEDFISFLVPDNDQLLPFAKLVLSKIEEGGYNKYQMLHRSKALIHTWLSWQNDPGTPLGLAITKRYLTTDVEKCKLFIQWIRLIFS